jgi:prolyl-tRNA synthetase
LDKENKESFVWNTSWGVSTRMIGALIMIHGDDKGLVLPPKIAYAHVVIVPIFYKPEEKLKVIKKSNKVKERLEKARLKVILDDREEYTPGWKFNEWELKGIPIRIEVGPKDVANKQVIAVRRDTFEKIVVEDKGMVKKINEILESIQKNLFDKAKKQLESNIFTVNTYEEFKNILENKGGFIRACWCLNPKCEEKIKEETKATVRVIPFKNEDIFSNCIYCGKEAKVVAYFAKAY